MVSDERPTERRKDRHGKSTPMLQGAHRVFQSTSRMRIFYGLGCSFALFSSVVHSFSPSVGITSTTCSLPSCPHQSTVLRPRQYTNCRPPSQRSGQLMASATENDKDNEKEDDGTPPNLRYSLQFGSNQEHGVTYGENSDDDEDRQRALVERQIKVRELVELSEEHIKQERRVELWGPEMAIKQKNATLLQERLEKEAKARDQEFAQQVALAQEQGVSLDVLDHEPLLESDDNNLFSAGPHSWYDKVDQELQEEWNELLLNEQNSTTDVPSMVRDRRSRAGVRVGSAGSWMLEIFPGDFVVHRKFGIGRFERTILRPRTSLTAEQLSAQAARRAVVLQQQLNSYYNTTGQKASERVTQQFRAQFGTANDTDPISNPQVTVLEIAYSDVKVHVPVHRAYRLSRFRAGDAVVKPKLSRARGQAWQKAKQRVEEATMAMAQDVLVLYSKREMLTRPPANPALENTEFDESFPYTPTPDQSKCFEDVENDMVWRKRPMDRLVCGDVGFGKTEVALRALIRCVRNGQQAALLAPTGVLAAQHYKTVMKRMGPDTPFNVTVGLLRGGLTKSTTAGRDIRSRIAEGEIQLIVGTHALLSKDLSYNDLGLLVIDEEQRFGVKQKERLKLICDGIDILTLSATPIPRTLQMSLSGIRDTSTIRSPPPMRKPVITYVQEISDTMIEKAISDELARGGQCYYVVPRISMIDEAEEKIRRLFPDIRIIQAHGRMKRNGAEENVAAFAEGEYDVLLATTVIENGVDIPTVNTIIVQNSQSFGMSTLYQLRGRVGRSDRQAYAYFLHKEETITEQASMRLQAISELNELGSGFDVANRDLEIRGAGSLLGTEQSGIAAKVGFDLYMRMLKKSVRTLRGLDLPLVPRTNVLLPTEGSPSSFKIPESFIPEASQRLTEESNARLADSTAALVAITNRWKEDYGPIPSPVQAQLKALHLHVCTRRLGIDLVGIDSDKNCILRSPGLRPRHWAVIVENLPRQAPPKGLDVVFPSRFSNKGVQLEINSREKVDLQTLFEDESLSEDKEDEEWEAIDQEEAEALNDISSAVDVKNLMDVDLDHYPRFVVKNFGNRSNGVDVLLKLLLPVARTVGEVQSSQVEDAKAAAALREKQIKVKAQQKVRSQQEAERSSLLF